VTKAYPGLRGAIVHSDRGPQYTSELYRKTVARYGIRQSMNSEGGRCHDNARCESMWTRIGRILVIGYGILVELLLPLAAIGIIIFRFAESICDKREKNTED